MTITELRELMMLFKKTDKIKADVLMMVLDKVQKKAKKEKRIPVEKDILPVVKTMLKMANQSKEAGMEVDYEIEILKSFLPFQMSYDEIMVAVAQVINDLGYDNMGIIMKALKSAFRDTMDFALASKIVKDRIKYLKERK